MSSIHALPAARGDAALLRELFTNVLSNAFKFTGHTAEPRIEIGGAREPGHMVMYHVRDNGVGFDMKYAGRLFKPFQRLHSEAQFEGIGVGLAIASRIVSRHGGALHAEAAPRQALSSASRCRPQAMNLTKRTLDAVMAAQILIIEDNDMSFVLADYLLRQAGYSTRPRQRWGAACVQRWKTRRTSSCAISTCP